MFFSATMPQPIAVLASEMLKTPARINIERQSAPASGITQALYPVAQDVKAALLCELLSRGTLQEVLVFTRTKHRANRLADHLLKKGINAARIHGNRSQGQRTEALQGFKSGKYRVLVATDIAARGIDVEALSHVVNFDVPAAPEDYIHRVGRTGRAEATGEAFTMVSPDEESDVRAIERAIGRTLPRVTLADFEYKGRAEALEVPRAERIAAIRARRAQERQRSQSRAAGGNRPPSNSSNRPQGYGSRPPSHGSRPAAQGNRPAAPHGNRAAGPGGRGPGGHQGRPARPAGSGPSRGFRG
jgi:ATP-dependent RNA helicase RhlE